jgi:hypothetical protein
MKHFIPEVVSLRNHPELKEKWLQARLAETPAMLGLGDLDVKDRERSQPSGGRLDLLLQDPDTLRRYEVEIQLGKTDESHIIRTIEYWDIERRRYPQYEHCAVIVAEDITGRFLNVISLFNGYIPLIAIKLQAISVNGDIGLVFTRVLDELPLGLDDEGDETQTDRNYWEKRATSKTVKLADVILAGIRDFAPDHQLKYNKHYIGLAKNGDADNFVSFRPRKTTLNYFVKIPKSEEVDEKLDASGLDVMTYDSRWREYRIRLLPDDVKKHGALLTELAKAAYDQKN